MKREDVSKIIPGITSDQLDSIMNLHGADITAKVNEITTLKAEKTTLTEQLSTANSKLEGYDPEWKAKAEQAKTDAAAQVAALEKGYALERKASGLKFSSESARKAFLAEAKAQNFAMKDGEIMGFDDYVKAFKESDPSAILPDGGMARFSASATGAPGRFAMTCCVQDIQFVGFPCSYDGYKALEQRAWVRVTAKVGYKFHNIYRGKGPVLTAISVEPAEKPLNDVVTFS